MPTYLRVTTGAMALGACLLLSFELIRRGIYGWTVFIILPLLAGALASWCFTPRTEGEAAGLGALVGMLGAGCFVMTGSEGIICVFLALPLFVPLALTGSWLAYKILLRDDRPPAAMALVLPLALFFDTHAKPPVYQVTTSLIINASPQPIWKNVVAFPDLPASSDWLAKTGIAFPVRTRIAGQGVGARRFCDLSTGPVVERVTVWDEPHTLRFTVLSTPPSMREMGLYGPVNAKHLNGYFISKAGQFTLTPLSSGRTLVEGTSWYQHGLWPALYWRCWSDAIVHHIHKAVLNHIRQLSENQAP